MRGMGTSIGHSQPRTSSGRKTLKRCRNNGEADNVVLIDVDSDDFNNVIIIDLPESLPQKLQGSSVIRKDKKCLLQNIIYIDDDESNDSHPGIGMEGGVDFYSDGSCRLRSCHASKNSRNSLDAVSNECQLVQENVSPLKLSKCKRTYSGKASTRNCYGLGPELMSVSFDNDCPDCELMEGSFGKLQEQWEKASLKRKYHLQNGQSAMGDQAGTSRFHTDTHHRVEVENTPEQRTKTPACSSSTNCCHEEENPSPFIATSDGNLGSTSCNPMKTPFPDFNLKTKEKTKFSHSKADVQGREESSTPDPPFDHAEQQSQKHVEHAGSSFCNEEEQNFRSSTQEKGNIQVNPANFILQDKEISPSAELCLSNSEPSVDKFFGHSEASFPDEEASFCRSQHSVETMVDHCRVAFRNKDEKFQQTPPKESKEEGNNSVDKEKSVSGEPSFWNTQPSDETEVNHGVTLDDEIGTVPKEGCQEKGISVPEEPSFYNVHHNEAQFKHRKSCLVEMNRTFAEHMSNSHQLDERDNQLHAQDGDVMHTVQSCIINEREKLKETDEYKQAIEEEWASRQQELQIQAEEAQQLRRLRKKRKAESMRLLDMERRQKQRVEEMREIQKKDEENMNLKEQLRAEVRKELIKLEITCPDMASLLRGLGIHVGSGLHPQPHEVHAAYKRALLNFHPDRASRSDICQLVEAEEKFKLISRMKEKFLSTS